MVKRFVIGFLLSLGFVVSAAAQSSEPEVIPGEYLIKFKASAGGPSLAQSKISGKASLKSSFGALGVFQISMKPGVDEQANFESFRNDPDVEYIEPNYVLRKQEVDSNADSEAMTYEQTFSSGLLSVSPTIYSQSSADTGVAEAWAVQTPLQTSNRKIVVAIIDTGLDKTHRVFTPYVADGSGGTGSLWINNIEAQGVAGVDDDRNGYVDDINGWNFITNSPNFADDDSHGTHVSGIVVGSGQNIFASSLSESKLQIMPLKFLGQGGSGSTSNAITAIYYAVNNGARVINNSWGGSTYSRALHDAITYAYDNGVLVVSAAGNYSTNNDSKPMYPASYDVPSNIAIASSDSWDYLSTFSNYGVYSVHISSPGESIYSTVPGNKIKSMSGTSMAAPLVAGMAALALREAPALSGYQMKQIILNSAQKNQSLSGKVSTGGRIGALNVLETAQSMIGVATFQPSYKPTYSREPASEESAAGGCGTVSSTLMKAGPTAGSGNTAGAVFALLMIPLILWQVMRARSPKSRRKHDRFKMNSEIRVMVGDRELVGAMNSISEGGVSFNTDSALEKGGIVTMRIQSPDGRETIEVQGQVVWSEANQAYGVQFANAKQGTLAMIRDWTSGLLKT